MSRHFHESIIKNNRYEIQRKINPRTVLDHMGDSISDVDRQRITQSCLQDGDIEGARKLVDVLLRSYPDTFVRFVEAVVKASSSGQILAQELYGCVPSRFKGKFSHIFPGIQDESAELTDEASDPRGVEVQPSRSGEPSMGLVDGNNLTDLKEDNATSPRTQQGDNVIGNLAFNFFSKKRGIGIQANLHCGFKVEGLVQSGHSQEAVAQLPASQGEEKSCYGQQHEEGCGSENGGTGTGRCVAKRFYDSRSPRPGERRTNCSFFSMVMESGRLSVGTGLANTTIRNFDSTAQTFSTGRPTVPETIIERQQNVAHFTTEKLSADQRLGLGEKQKQQIFCVESRSLDDELRNTTQKSDGASGTRDQYSFCIDPDCHFMKRIYKVWLTAIQNATDTVFCQYLKQSEDLEGALSKSVEGRDD
ncbi:uncharacterized protein LOC135481383 [Liolophura sinensis]|uniref:uncharacterized protein LOC135481383 n=1 Tax=Liolophura sinensis TaxID=3198878 RepID=UPI00315847CA